jgi:molybdate transport system permease protein
VLAALDFSDPFPIWLSLRVAALAMLIATPIGIALAWIQARHQYRLRWLVDVVILLPLVLPPTVLGYFLLIVIGPKGWIGQYLDAWFGIRLVFNPGAAVVASAVVALPLLVKTVQPALEGVPHDLLRVGRSLGLAPLALFFRVSLPFAWRGVLAGLVLAFARAIGEFGATLMLCGNQPGRTNTMPLDIYASFVAGDDARSLAYVWVLTGMGVLVVLVASFLGPRARKP